MFKISLEKFNKSKVGSESIPQYTTLTKLEWWENMMIKAMGVWGGWHSRGRQHEMQSLKNAMMALPSDSLGK